jgi:hypothetical protein
MQQIILLHRAAIRAMVGARREGVLNIPARRIPCPDHLAFLTSARAYECYVEYWNGKVKEMEPRRRRGSMLYDRRDGNLRDTL